MKLVGFFNELDFQDAYVKYLNKMHVWLEKKDKISFFTNFQLTF